MTRGWAGLGRRVVHQLLYLLLPTTGCYHPTLQTGAPCDTASECPREQECIAGLCQPPGTPAADGDGPPDVDPPPDADPSLDADPSRDADPWVEITAVPGVNTNNEDDPSWTSDRRTIVFVSRRNGGDDLFEGTRASTTDVFSVRSIAELNSFAPGGMSSPEISADGTRIYFTADHDGDGKHNVYMSHRSGAIWSTTDIASSPLSDGSDDESDVAISPDGVTAMVARNGRLMIATLRPDGSFDAPMGLTSATIPADAAAPSITNHADIVYFHAGEPRDLYYMTSNGGMLTQPMPVTELDTPGRDSAPFVSGDGCHLLFARGQNIYQATRRSCSAAGP